MKNLACIFIIMLLAFSCQKSPQENNNQLIELVKQQTDRLRHIPSINPIVAGKIINRFGQQIDSLTNKTYLKKGIDIIVEQETNVFAAAAGKIVAINQGETNDKNLVIIDHGYGFQTKYSNLSEILVIANQSVKRWSVISKIKKSADKPALLHYSITNLIL